MITMLRIGTRSCFHQLTSGAGRSVGSLIWGGHVGFRQAVARRENVKGISWRNGPRWAHTAMAETLREEEEVAEQDPQQPDDDETPPSTSNPFTLTPNPPGSSPPPTAPQIPTKEDPTIPLLRKQYDLPAYLRPYQVQVVDACMKALGRGVRRIGVSCPTGSGKTVIL